MVDFRLPPLNAAERFYRALLHVYPPSFRRAYSQDLVETFRDQRRAAVRAGVPAVAFALVVLRDVLVQGVAERLASVRRLFRRDALTHEDSMIAVIPPALRLGELRVALRRLRRAPVFAVSAASIIALGLGATTAVFSIVNGILLRPLPYRAPERLVAIQHTLEIDGVTTLDQSDGGLLYYQEHAKAFTGVAGWRDRSVNVEAPAGAARPVERISAVITTANLFDVLGATPELGRSFRAGEDRATAAPVVILSDGLWSSMYGRNPGVIGKRIVIDGVSREIVGVMPHDFKFVDMSPELYLPIPLDRATATVTSFNYHCFARLRDGATPATARADLVRILPHTLDEFPSGVPRAMWEKAHVQPVVQPLADYIVGDVARSLWILLGSVTLVLAIACANVASLFLVRGESRQHELAVRGALGSGRVGMMAQCLSESFLLSMIGGALGVALAAFAVRLTAAIGDQLALPRLNEVSIDLHVVLFAFAASLFCAICVSLVPVARARRIPIATALRDSGRASTAGRARQRASSTLVIAQVALALVLVTASGLLVHSFMHLRDVRVGFDPTNVSVARLMLPESTYPTNTSVALTYDRLLGQMRALPGVSGATLADWVPLTGDNNSTVVGVEDHPLPPNAVPRVHSVTSIDGNYFKMMGIPLIAGQSFGAVDPAHPSPDAIVSQSFAQRYWPGGSALGKRIRVGIEGPWLTIVGVVSNVHYDALDKEPNEMLYLPIVTADLAQSGVSRFMTILVRSSRPQPVVAQMVRDAVRAIDPSVPTYGERSMESIASSATARARVMLLLLATASALALLLGAVGIYGVMAYGVSLRQREIGVRIALGAQPGEVSRMVSRQGLTLGVSGVAIGVVCALGVTRLLRGLLYQVSPTDPASLIGACVAMLAVALLASWAPARRAASIDPIEALRRG